MKKFLFVLLVMGLVLSSGPVWAKDGFYLGMDLGVAVAPEMDVQTGGLDDWTPPRSSVNRVTRCDRPSTRIGCRRWTEGQDACEDGELRAWGPYGSRLMVARASWRAWPWGIAWGISGSRVNISIAVPYDSTDAPYPSHSRQYGGGLDCG